MCHDPPSQTTLDALRAETLGAVAEERTTTDTIIERLVRRAKRRGDATLDILLLSWGTTHGAYGAGFLRGWRERTDVSMPTFDLVSGISTGGLQAPFALMATPRALDTLSTLYRHMPFANRDLIDVDDSGTRLWGAHPPTHV